MKNEALETHLVRRADLWAVPKATPKQEVYADQDERFWQANGVQKPTGCRSEVDSCLEEIQVLDGNEYVQPADSNDLLTGEVLEINFESNALESDTLGLVIAQRQSLLTTFLFYQALDYMGSDVGNWFARLERTAAMYEGNSFLGKLRGIKVQGYSMGQQRWKTIGTIRERGPLASDVQVVRVPGNVKTDQFRLKMIRGNYRIDYVALTGLGKQVEPLKMSPASILYKGERDTAALLSLTDSTRTLTTLPGDVYRLQYKLPNTKDYAFFLNSKGYYLEWMRPQWLRESKPGKLTELIFNPDKTLEDLAPKYKKIEQKMRKLFWQSRYATPSYQ